MDRFTNNLNVYNSMKIRYRLITTAELNDVRGKLRLVQQIFPNPTSTQCILKPLFEVSPKNANIWLEIISLLPTIKLGLMEYENLNSDSHG